MPREKYRRSRRGERRIPLRLSVALWRNGRPQLLIPLHIPKHYYIYCKEKDIDSHWGWRRELMLSPWHTTAATIQMRFLRESLTPIYNVRY